MPQQSEDPVCNDSYDEMYIIRTYLLNDRQKTPGKVYFMRVDWQDVTICITI